MQQNFLRFEATVGGSPHPEVVWFKDGKELTKLVENGHYSFEEDSNGHVALCIKNCTLEDDAEYLLLAENVAGIDQCHFDLIVEWPGDCMRFLLYPQ